MTVAFALLLPAIPWLMPIGILVGFGSTFIMRTEAQAARELWGLFLVAALAIASVTIQIRSGRGFAIPKDGPDNWYVFMLVITWVAGVVWDYRRWRMDRSAETDVP